MKTTLSLMATLALLLTTINPALASGGTTSTHTVYNSGILVLAFVGFCALVVVIQLIPAIMTLWGMVVGLLTNSKQAEVKVHK